MTTEELSDALCVLSLAATGYGFGCLDHQDPNRGLVVLIVGLSLYSIGFIIARYQKD